MRSDDIVAEEADGVEVEAGKEPVLFFGDLLQLGARFRNVNEDRRVQLIREFASRLQVFA